MAAEFNTQVGDGLYRLQFETDSEDYYKLMQETARRCVDGIGSKNTEKAAQFMEGFLRGRVPAEIALFVANEIRNVRNEDVETYHAAIAERDKHIALLSRQLALLQKTLEIVEGRYGE